MPMLMSTQNFWMRWSAALAMYWAARARSATSARLWEFFVAKAKASSKEETVAGSEGGAACRWAEGASTADWASARAASEEASKEVCAYQRQSLKAARISS